MNFPTPPLNSVISSSEPLEGIVSIYGDFGVGKTTFALQIALDIAKKGKKVVYIYSKPNFPSEKVVDILKDETPEGRTDILDNVIFIQTKDFEDLNAIIFNLEFLVLSNLKDKDNMLNLIVIDSITDLYRLELIRDKKGENVKLNYQLNQILANLFYVNEAYYIEVLVVNEISRKSLDDETIEVQSGGKVMDYWVKYAIKIDRTEILNERKFKLSKHPENKSLEFTSKLQEKGFE